MKSPMPLAMYCAQNFRAFFLAMLMCCSATAQDAQPPLDITQAPDNQAVQKKPLAIGEAKQWQCEY